MVCKNCGEVIADGVSICQNCGTPVENEVKESPVSEVAPVQTNDSVEVLTSEPMVNSEIATPVGTVVENTEVLETPPVVGMVADTPLTTNFNQVQPEFFVQEEKIEEKPQKKGNGLVVGLIMLVVGIVIGLGSLYLLANTGIIPLSGKECEPKVETETVVVKQKSVTVNGFTFNFDEKYKYTTTDNSVIFSDDKLIAEVIITDKVYDNLKSSKDFIAPYFSSNGYNVTTSDVKTFSSVEVITISASKDNVNYIFGYVNGLNGKTYGIGMTNVENNIAESVWDTIIPILKGAVYSAETGAVTGPVDSNIIGNIEL